MTSSAQPPAPRSAPGAAAPLFVVGAPRSGTSLLYKALCLHPDAAWVSNYLRRAPAVAPLAGLNRVASRMTGTRQRVWFGADGASAYAYGRRRQLAERLFPQPVEGEPVFAHAGIPEVADGPATGEQRRAVQRALADVARYGGGSVVVSKRIAHNRRIPLLADAVPDGRFVMIVRDGRAVTSSLLRVDWWPDTTDVWWYDGTPRDWEAAGGDPVELAARHWVRDLEEIERGLGAVAGPRVLRVSYEGLVADPATVLHEIAAFAGLRGSRAWDRALASISFPNQNDSWPQRLGDKRALVEEIQGVALRRYGYAVDGAVA